MDKHFIFSEHFMENMLRFSLSMLPNLQKGIAVYRQTENSKLCGCLLEAVNAQTSDDFTKVKLQSVDVQGYLPFFFAQMKEKSSLQWLSVNDLPFVIASTERKLDVFSELENTILLLRFPSENDYESGLLYLFFKPRMANFGLAHAEKPLGADHKSIIEHLVIRTLNTFRQVLIHEKRVYHSISGNTRNLVNELIEARQEIKLNKEAFGSSIISLCNEFLKNLADEKSIHAVFTQSAETKIASYNGAISGLKEIIRKALLFALFINENAEKNQSIAIDDWHLDFRVMDGDTTEKPQSTKDARHQKTMKLLDKLESAALKVLASNMPLTGDNVGKNCPQPVSAPAISDSIKKHKLRIVQLLDIHPDKWPVIRQQFKPITNILMPASFENMNALAG